MKKNTFKDSIVILDLDIPALFNNRLFDPAAARKVSHTLLPFVHLARELHTQGIPCVTPDVFCSLKKKPRKALLISHLVTPYTKKVIALGARPTILLCQESPYVAARFYLNLRKYSSWYAHSFVFSGMQRQLSARTKYHQMFFPQANPVARTTPYPFAKKKPLAIVIGNKTYADFKKDVLLKLWYGKEIHSLWSLRTRLIAFFAGRSLLDIYGQGWETALPRLPQAIQKAFRGTTPDKMATLHKYKFSLCLENSVFPGYITEKIFDAMFAGSVPVYIGAPDIGQYIPKETFIDLRTFKNDEALIDYLQSMTPATYAQYMKNIEAFLRSKSFQLFSKEYFAGEIVSILKKELASEY